MEAKWEFYLFYDSLIGMPFLAPNALGLKRLSYSKRMAGGGSAWTVLSLWH
jgi:hypothetical protein